MERCLAAPAWLVDGIVAYHVRVSSENLRNLLPVCHELVLQPMHIVVEILEQNGALRGEVIVAEDLSHAVFAQRETLSVHSHSILYRVAEAYLVANGVQQVVKEVVEAFVASLLNDLARVKCRYSFAANKF